MGQEDCMKLEAVPMAVALRKAGGKALSIQKGARADFLRPEGW